MTIAGVPLWFELFQIVVARTRLRQACVDTKSRGFPRLKGWSRSVEVLCVAPDIGHERVTTMAPKLDTAAARLRLPVARKPLFIRILPGVSLGYRRNRSAGTWVERVSTGGPNYETRRIGTADDGISADGVQVLSFWQAQELIRLRARGRAGQSKVTVARALDLYEADLRRRGREPANVSRVRRRLPLSLADTEVRALTSKGLRTWRDSLAGITPATVNRLIMGLRAALNLAASADETVVNGRAWTIGLARLPNADRSRNAASILDDATVRQLVVAAHEVAADFGLLIEVAAVTGARIGQIVRLTVRDLQADRLMMPPSNKGSGSKPDRVPVPIQASLAKRLRRAAPLGASLLVRADGSRWPTRSERGATVARELWAQIADRCGVTATMYALRHSSIVRGLLRGVPIRVVAAAHDTSVNMIEKTYSRYIADHSDALVRGSLLDMGFGQ
jgi:integrase